MNNIDNIMDKMIQDKPAEAKELLDQELKDRIAVAMAEKKPEIAGKLFDKSDEPSKKEPVAEPEEESEISTEEEPEEKSDEIDN
jgi:hypothetical protein